MLFDLDGTLADTAADLANALNCLRRERGHAPMPLDVIRPAVSLGGAAMLKLGLDLEPEHPDFEPARERFLEHYRGRLAVETRLFPGMEALLSRLEDSGYRWGVVTNKPGWLTAPLLEELGLAARAACVISGDSTPWPKPHPAPYLRACEVAGCLPRQALCLGDARRDIQAGNEAGLTTLIAAYGYIDPGEDLEQWGAHGIVHEPLELLGWLQRPAP